MWPWIEVTRNLVLMRDAEQVLSAMGSGAADIAEIVPDLKAKVPGLQPPPALEPEQASFRLYDSMTRFLANDAHAQPLMLILEDLHWADTSSLRLLEFLGGHISE